MMFFRCVSCFKTCSMFSPYRYSPRITTQTKSGLVTEHHIGLFSHTPMSMFQTPVQTSAFMRRREGNANCWSSGIHASVEDGRRKKNERKNKLGRRNEIVERKMACGRADATCSRGT
ncbi:uncharacterized protein TNCV_2913891 [Trichonephila clavipes]|nr:uncharacterized protein TNCV_2913891 [Trichonephila clavipes]